MSIEPVGELWPALVADPTLLSDTLNQLLKDMRTNGIHAKWDAQTPMSELLPAMEQQIATLLSQQAPALRTLMYTVDVAEPRLAQAIAAPNPPRAVAELLLMRSLQKVVLRRRFS